MTALCACAGIGRSPLPRRQARLGRLGLQDDFSDGVFGALVEAEGAVGGVAEDAVPGPPGESDLADQLGFDPGGGFGGLGGDVERAGLHLEGSEAFPEVAQGLLVEPGADLAAMDQPVAFQDGEDQGADLVGPPAATGGVAGDDAGLAQPGLDLQPVRAADPGTIERVGALPDDAFDARLAGDLEERGPVALDVLREEDVRRVDDGFAQCLLADAELGAEEVAAVKLEEVERHEGHRVLRRHAADIGLTADPDALLDALERGTAVGIEDDQLAVDDRLTCANPGSDRLCLGVAGGLVSAATTGDADQVAGNGHHRADAVVLQLEEPSVPRKRVIHWGCEHRRRRLDKRWRGCLRRGDSRGRARSRGAAHLARVTPTLGGDLRQASAGLD